MTRIETRLTGAFVWLTLLTTALAGGFFFLMAQISGGYDKIDTRLRAVEQSSAAQLETLKSMDRQLERADDHGTASAKPDDAAPAK